MQDPLFFFFLVFCVESHCPLRYPLKLFYQVQGSGRLLLELGKSFAVSLSDIWSPLPRRVESGFDKGELAYFKGF